MGQKTCKEVEFEPLFRTVNSTSMAIQIERTHLVGNLATDAEVYQAQEHIQESGISGREEKCRCARNLPEPKEVDFTVER